MLRAVEFRSSKEKGYQGTRGLQGDMVGRHVGALLPLIRTPSGLSGALFTSRGTYTLPFIWARPLTSTEKGFFFFQGMSGSKLLDALSGHADERETRQNAPPPPPHSPSSLLANLRPQSPHHPPPSFLCPQADKARLPTPLPVGLAQGQLNLQAPTPFLPLPQPPYSGGCQVSGEPGSMKQSIVRLR